MPETAAQATKMSSGEIKIRVKGIIAETFSVGCDAAVTDLYLRYVGAGSGEGRSPVAIGVLVDRIERAFDVALPEAKTYTFAALGTVGDLIAVVEGALSAAGGIA